MMRSLGAIDIRRRDRAVIIEELLQSIFNSGLVAVYVAEIASAPKADFDYQTLTLKRNSSILTCAVASPDLIQPAVKMICGTTRWDRSSFAVIVGDSQLAAEMLSKGDVIRSAIVPVIQQALDSEIVGYLFPIDYELVVYGTPEFEPVVTELAGFES